jgi:hypothetical protein
MCKIPKLPTTIHVRSFSLRGVGTDRHPLQELEWVALHDFTIFECARFRFVGIGDYIARENTRRQEPPFHAGREPRPTPAAQPGSPHDIDDFLRCLSLDDFLKGLIAAVLAVDI